MELPQELESLLSCGQCRRRYDLVKRRMPKELVCQHVFCEECVTGTMSMSSHSLDYSRCLLCGVCTPLSGKELAEPKAIIFLLRQIPAFRLGMVMIEMTDKSTEKVIGKPELKPELEPELDPTDNWLDHFLTHSSEHCLLHAMPSSTWCHICKRLLCRACSDGPLHFGHRLTRQLDYQELLRQLTRWELGRIKHNAAHANDLAVREMRLLQDVGAALSDLQLDVKREMLQHKPSMVACQMRGWHKRAERDLNRSGESNMVRLLTEVSLQRRQFDRQLKEVHIQCRLRAAIHENGLQVLDFRQLNDRVLRLCSTTSPGVIPHNVDPPRSLILTNYCVFTQWNKQCQVIPPRFQTSTPVHHSRLFDYNNINRFYMEQLNPTSLQTVQHQHPKQQQKLQLYQHYPDPPLFQLDPLWVKASKQRITGLANVTTNNSTPPDEDDDKDEEEEEEGSSSDRGTSVSIVRLPSRHCYPIYYLEMETAGQLTGRILIEVRPDAAPLMSNNFGALVRQDYGFGYRGCAVFQAWGAESIITGDFESNNGQGGHSAFKSRFFIPDNTDLPPVRGSIGMRRGQKRLDKDGSVGSQFRLVLNEKRPFTAIFGYIIEGIEVADMIAGTGNAMGRPTVKSVIRNCGEYR